MINYLYSFLCNKKFVAEICREKCTPICPSPVKIMSKSRGAEI
jgi:hypothetical protein